MVQVYSFTQYNIIFHHAIRWWANPQCHFHSIFFYVQLEKLKPCKNKRNLSIPCPIRIQFMIFNKIPRELKNIIHIIYLLFTHSEFTGQASSVFWVFLATQAPYFARKIRHLYNNFRMNKPTKWSQIFLFSWTCNS